MGTCPECEENIEYQDEWELGSVFDCPKCKIQLEIIDLHPLAFDFASE